MKEISKILIEARKNRGIDLEQATRDTNISKQFLVGLESDNYDDFPAETYVLGFLRNYAKYLGLDADEVLKLYKQTKLQESEIPPEVILSKEPFSKKPIFIVLAIILGIFVVSGIIFFALKKFKLNPINLPKTNTAKTIQQTKAEKTKVIETNKTKNYEIAESHYEDRFFEGDAFSLKIADKNYTFKVKKTLEELELETEKLGTQIVRLGESRKIDLNDDTIADIEIALGDIDKSDAKKGALLVISTGQNIGKQNGADVALTTNAQNYTTIFEGASAYPVTMNVTFRGYCLFRYEIDRKERKEFYYQKSASLSIRADNAFRIWASNGNAAKVELIGAGRKVELELTKPGEVIVRDLKWIKDENNRYKFVVINVD